MAPRRWPGTTTPGASTRTEGWGSGGTYTAEVVYSLEDLSGLVEYPENFVYVNWIINQDWIGQTSAGGYGTYTYGDVQRSIWELIEDTASTAGLGNWSQDRVDEILADAAASGSDFVPGCLDQVAVVLVPIDGNGNINRQVKAARGSFTRPRPTTSGSVGAAPGRKATSASCRPKL